MENYLFGNIIIIKTDRVYRKNMIDWYYNKEYSRVGIKKSGFLL